MESQLMQELLTYLNGHGFKRLWPMVKKKMERLDRVGGRFTLSGLTFVERQAIEGLLAVNLHGVDRYTVDLKQLNHALVRSRFETTLDECMNLLYPGEFISRRAERQSEQARWSEFCGWAKSHVTNQTLGIWIDALSSQSGTAVGYRTFRECYEEFREVGDSVSWRHAVWGLNLLRDGGMSFPLSLPIRLPIFAALAAGDPHGLDRNTLAGRMFFWGLMALRQPTGAQVDVDSEQATVDIGAGEDMGFSDYVDAGSDWSNLESSDGEIVRAVYRWHGILLDDISSFVFVARLPGVAERPTALPLLTVDELTISENRGAVFVVENPSIFGALSDLTEGLGGGITGASEFTVAKSDTGASTTGLACSPLVCTSGQPSVAALHLLDKLTAAGFTIYYSGDFDVAGLKIAVTLANRYGKSFIPWRWQAANYLGVDHPDLPKLSDTDLTRLGEMTLPWESNVAPKDSLLHAMKVRGAKVFQEHLIEPLKEDYVSDGSGRDCQ